MNYTQSISYGSKHFVIHSCLPIHSSRVVVQGSAGGNCHKAVGQNTTFLIFDLWFLSFCLIKNLQNRWGLKREFLKGFLEPNGSFLILALYLWKILIDRGLCSREAATGSLSLSVLCIKTRPNYAILRCSLATGTLCLLPKSLRQRYSGLTVCPDTALTLPS